MKRTNCKKPAALALSIAFFFLTAGIANGQWNSPNAYGHSTGYGTVYGSYGLASTMQSMYNVARAQSQRRAPGKAESAATPRSTSKDSAATVSPPARVVRNHGVFRPDASVDTGKELADALGDTPEEKALIKQIYTSTKTTYETEAATRGWKNNIAGGLTFFTVAAMTVYHDAEEPDAGAVDSHYKLFNAALDETPDFAAVSNKNKQGFNNVMIGFGGILLAGYSEGKQTGNAATLASYKQLAGMLIEMVLKTDPKNLRVENGQIVMN